MAFASDSTTAPFGHPRLLRATPVPTPALTAETVALLDAIEPDTIDDVRRDLDALIAGARVELPPEPLLPADSPHGVASFLSFEEPLGGVSRFGDTPDLGRAIHLRRQLEAAAEHGADLLAALGLPRLVGPDTIIVDPVAAGDALDLAIRTLDALDADPDLEDEPDHEPGGDDEHSLGWREAVTQTHLGNGSDDGEHTLGAPERGPWSAAMGASFYKPANGRRLVRCFHTRAWSQAEWAAGLNADGEGEPEAGYDLPEGDDEKCGSEHDGCEPEEQEHSLGSPAGDGDQRHWCQGDGQDVEAVDEDGEDGGGRFLPAARPTSPRRPDPMGFRCAEERRAMARRARDVRARLRPATARDPDELTIYRNGRAAWSGPYVTRDGVPVIGFAT